MCGLAHLWQAPGSRRAKGIRYLIEEELMNFLAYNREDLLDRMARRLLEDAEAVG